MVKFVNYIWYKLKQLILLALLVVSANSFAVQKLASEISVQKITEHASLEQVTPKNTVKLTHQSNAYQLTNKVSYLVDENNQYSLSDVQRDEVNSTFKLLNKNNLSLGYIKSAVWLHFVVDATLADEDKWLLTFDYPLLDNIDIFIKPYQNDDTSNDTSVSWQHTSLGDSHPYSARPISYRLFITPLNMAENKVQEVYVRIHSSSSMQIRPSISSSQAFFIKELDNEMFYGIVYGIMLLMALYNIFLFINVKDSSYLIYVLSVFSGCVFIMALNGHAYQYLWPQSPTLANTAIPIFTSLWLTTTALFTQKFLETKQYAPLLHKVINVLILSAVFTLFVSVFSDYQIAIKFATALALLNGLLILTTCIACWLNGNVFAKYFVIAWSIYGLGTALLVVSRYGLIADNFLTHNSAALGLLIEIIMLSIALSVKYKLLTQELKNNALELENKVILRTKELEESNKKLQTLSSYDSLTGIPNRRYFDKQLAKEWDRSKREKLPLSILVCDVDEFKSINDHYGHQYGDKCLQSIAKALLNVLHRPADMPARFGGDEFVVILPNTVSLGAELMGIQICEDVEGLSLKQAPGAMQNVVTLSIGCATLIPSDDNDIKALFAQADKNLFKAKDQGRNCVFSARETH